MKLGPFFFKIPWHTSFGIYYKHLTIIYTLCTTKIGILAFYSISQSEIYTYTISFMWQSAIESQHQSLESNSKNNENLNSHNELFDTSIFFISNFLINSHSNSKYIHVLHRTCCKVERMYVYMYRVVFFSKINISSKYNLAEDYS